MLQWNHVYGSWWHLPVLLLTLSSNMHQTGGTIRACGQVVFFPDSCVHLALGNAFDASKNKKSRTLPQPLLRLRGGVREGRVITCPSKEYVTVKEGVEATCKGDVTLIGQGDHRLAKTLTIGNRTLDVAGEQDACILGRWLLDNGSRGGMAGISLAMQWGEDADNAWISERVVGDSGSAPGYTLKASSGPWEFDQCRIEATSGSLGSDAALMAEDGAHLILKSCHIGGQGDGAARTELGIVAKGNAFVSLDACGVSLCKSFAVTASDDSQISASGGGFARCSVAIKMEDCVEVRISKSQVQGDQAAFYIEERARFSAKLFLKDTEIIGHEWMYDMLPCKHSSDPADQQGLEEDEWSDTHASVTWTNRGLANMDSSDMDP